MCLQPPGRQAGIPKKAFLRSEAEWTWPGSIPRNYKDYLFSEKEDDLEEAFNLSDSGSCTMEVVGRSSSIPHQEPNQLV